MRTLDLNNPTLVDHNLRFKQAFLQTLYDESGAVKAFYEPMMQTRKKEIAYWKSCKKSLVQKVVEVGSAH